MGHSIDCGWQEAVPAITAAATPRGERSIGATRKRYEAWGIATKDYSAEDLRRIIGTTYYRYGIQSSTRALVQPAALHRGLADNLPAGVTLLENTPVHALSEAAPFMVATSRGNFVADRVLSPTTCTPGPSGSAATG